MSLLKEIENIFFSSFLTHVSMLCVCVLRTFLFQQNIKERESINKIELSQQIILNNACNVLFFYYFIQFV